MNEQPFITRIGLIEINQVVIPIVANRYLRWPGVIGFRHPLKIILISILDHLILPIH